MQELIRPTVFVSGVLLAGLAGAMLVTMVVGASTDGRDWPAFAAAAALTAFTGGALATASQGRFQRLSVRAGFLLTTGSWVILTVFAALPFLFIENALSPTDAAFEATSGLTTTGATILQNLDTRSNAILLWRSILQWIGGVGILVTAMAILPFLRVGGMQLFRLESSDSSEKMLPRAKEFAGYIALVYVGLTAACGVSYLLAGMGVFDAVCHAMTTIATGGFSTKSESLGWFLDNGAPGADLVAMVFMTAAALPFGVYIFALRGQSALALRDSQSQAFVSVLVVVISVMTVYVLATGSASGLEALRSAAVNVISIITGTGYSTTNYGAWGPFAVAVFFCLTFIGGCAGSTSCGAKVFRFQVAAKALSSYGVSMLRPHAVTGLRYNGRPLSRTVVQSVLSFFFVYFLTFGVLAVILSAYNLDTVTALSAAATSVANVGPGLGATVGPTGDFAPLPDGAKWAMAFGMLLGRLELFTVLVLLTPAFWRS